ncbi:hypothetical protein [Granulibacter bethesdensis]|uniref:Uncharacterized protein n=1 Tax=Granulibacter bethesdensis (strain ATCC BAA-1260 / CGDNIH1) TaxID=391165 RepID=Q0BT63_GRABC|nr:hypothetical protein [Granulibacter bethesdensis]ABI61989.1 Hypothetical protein GbCGDNIH1_1091 [Granulibacter bethesdensis CGDNIH1]APH51807.1 Hypothetical protein GbCGDNIH5_1091 [Granulibacter bethesdensis]APH64499.1 Hypothetical protein GbCGDNIH1I4_1091 [Granulibacter bethesdensis]
MIRFGAVIVHGMEDIRRTLRHASVAQTGAGLLSTPGALASGGCGWWLAMMQAAGKEFPDIPFQSLADCGNAPGLAAALLRATWPVDETVTWQSGESPPLMLILSPSPASTAIGFMAESARIPVISTPPPAFHLPLKGGRNGTTLETLLTWLKTPA